MKELFKEKKNVVRLIFFLLAAAVAVGAITGGVMGFLHRDSGFYDVGFTAEGDTALYGSGLHLMYYAEGSSSQIRQTVNEMQKTFSDLALRYTRLLDGDGEYDGMVNLATLNRHPGETWILDEDLFDALTDALEKTERGEGYSLFAGALHREWQGLRYLEEPEEFDPLLNEEEQERIRALTEITNRAGVFSLSLNPNTREACLTVDEAYLSAMEEMELNAPILDFNLLHDAYLLRLIARDLIRQGRTAGYLYAESGVSVALQRNGQMAFEIWTEDQGMAKAAAEIRLDVPCVYCQWTAFSPAGEKYGYYQVTVGENARLRSPFVDVGTGDTGNAVLTVSLGGGMEQMTEIAYQGLTLMLIEGQAELEARLSAWPEEIFLACALQGQPSTLYAPGSGAGKILLSEDGGVTLTIL